MPRAEINAGRGAGFVSGAPCRFETDPTVPPTRTARMAARYGGSGPGRGTGFTAPMTGNTSDKKAGRGIRPGTPANGGWSGAFR